MTNRELLKEAIADAKAVKEVAITNAKAALEEAFTPHLKSMLEKKLTEMEEEDEYMNEAEHEDEGSMDEINLEELLKELEDESEEGESEEESEEHESEEESEEEEEIDLDNMTSEDLEKFIESVVDEMIQAGELEAGHEGMEDEAGAESEEEMQENEEPLQEENTSEEEKKHHDMHEASEKVETMEKELEEALKTIQTLKAELHEINLLNSKLLFTNKIFKAKNLTEAQKVQVLAAFDKAETVKETKLVYETLSAGLNKISKKELVKEHKSFASKTIGSTSKQPVVETNAMVERFQILAGLKQN